MQFRRRTLTRMTAVQAAYQADLLMDEAPTLTHTYLSDGQRLQDESLGATFKGVDRGFYTLLVQGVLSHSAGLDALIAAHLVEGWTLERLDKVIKAILKVAAYELQYIPNAKSAIILSEYTDITDSFYDEPEPKKFVNGVLNAIAQTVQSATPSEAANPFP